MTEMRDHLDELLDRGTQLGASNDQLEWLIENWWGMDEGEQYDIRKMNDVRFGAYIRRPIPAPPSKTPTVDRAVADYKSNVVEHRDEDLTLLAMPYRHIAEEVGDDRMRAQRLLDLETAAHKPRTTVLRMLAEVIAQ